MEGSMTVALLDDASPSIWDARRKRGLRPVMRSAPRRWRRRILGALVIGYLLFCHGCHGDEDNELFTKSLKQKWGQAPRPAEPVPIFEARGSASASSGLDHFGRGTSMGNGCGSNRTSCPRCRFIASASCAERIRGSSCPSKPPMDTKLPARMCNT